MARPEEYEGRCAQIDAVHPQLGRRSVQKHSDVWEEENSFKARNFNGQGR